MATKDEIASLFPFLLVIFQVLRQTFSYQGFLLKQMPPGTYFKQYTVGYKRCICFCLACSGIHNTFQFCVPFTILQCLTPPSVSFHCHPHHETVPYTVYFQFYFPCQILPIFKPYFKSHCKSLSSTLYSTLQFQQVMSLFLNYTFIKCNRYMLLCYLSCKRLFVLSVQKYATTLVSIITYKPNSSSKCEINTNKQYLTEIHLKFTW